MDEDLLIEPRQEADCVERQRSKLAHPFKTSTKEKSQEANTDPGCKTNPQMKCENTASCPGSSHDIEDGWASGVNCKITPEKKRNETANTKDVSEHVSDGKDTSEPKKEAKKGKVVKKGIAQVVKKEKKKGGWK